MATSPAPTADTPSDDDLVKKAQAGDRGALDAIVRRYQGRLMRFAMRQCGDPQRAEDAVQDGLLALVRWLPQYRGDSTFSTWVFTIVRNACYRRARKRKHEPAHMLSLDAPPDDDAAPPPVAVSHEDDAVTRLQSMELGAALERAMVAVEPRSREIMLLRDVEGLPAEEVARITGLKVPAVKSRLHRARVQVRNAIAPLLDADEVHLPAAGRGCRDVVRIFSRYLEGEIDGQMCKRMQSHVDGCARCRAQCASLKRTLALCTSVPAEVPPDQQLRIRSALQEALQELAPSAAR